VAAVPIASQTKLKKVEIKIKSHDKFTGKLKRLAVEFSTEL
jgi:hypothetical protein